MVDGASFPGVRAEGEGVETPVSTDHVDHGNVGVHEVEVVAGREVVKLQVFKFCNDEGLLTRWIIVGRCCEF